MINIKNSIVCMCISIFMVFLSFSPAYAAGIDSTQFSTSCTVAPGESKIVSLYIRNNDSKEHSFTLSAEGTLNKYDIYFTSAGSAAKSIKIQSGGSSQIDMNIGLNGVPSSDKDVVLVKAIREDGKKSSFEVYVLVNKEYSLAINSMLDKVEILNGKEAELSFSVTNNGSMELNLIKLLVELPDKWRISQGADEKLDLKAGETGTLKMKIEVPSSQSAGNYSVKIAATDGKTKSEQVGVFATVRTSPTISFWMFGIILIIAVFTYIQFKKHGRR